MRRSLAWRGVGRACRGRRRSRHGRRWPGGRGWRSASAARSCGRESTSWSTAPPSGTTRAATAGRRRPLVANTVLPSWPPANGADGEFTGHAPVITYELRPLYDVMLRWSYLIASVTFTILFDLILFFIFFILFTILYKFLLLLRVPRCHAPVITYESRPYDVTHRCHAPVITWKTPGAYSSSMDRSTSSVAAPSRVTRLSCAAKRDRRKAGRSRSSVTSTSAMSAFCSKRGSRAACPATPGMRNWKRSRRRVPL